MSTMDQETYGESSSDEEYSDYDFSDDEQEEEEESFLEWTSRQYNENAPRVKSVVFTSSDYSMWIVNKLARYSFYAVTTAAMFIPLLLAQNAEAASNEYNQLRHEKAQMQQPQQQAQGGGGLGTVGMLSSGIPQA